MTYRPGQWNVICDVCGVRFKSDEVRLRWDGLIVCKKDWEPDHPQKYLRLREDPRPVPFIRPEAEDRYIIGSLSENSDGSLTVVHTCDLWTRAPMPEFGVADCATVDGETDIEVLIEYFDPYSSSIADKAIAGYSLPGVT